MAHHRLFVALRPPAAIRAALIGMMGGVPGARWQDDGQLHCTLRFIGEVDRHQAEDIAAALGQVHHPAMMLTLAEIGVFDRGGRVDTLWIGVQPREAVKALHARVDQALRRAGVAPDERAFLPHVTLARFARGAAVTADVARHVPQAARLVFTAESFELLESHLGSEGAVHETVARYPLTSFPD